MAVFRNTSIMQRRQTKQPQPIPIFFRPKIQMPARQIHYFYNLIIHLNMQIHKILYFIHSPLVTYYLYFISFRLPEFNQQTTYIRSNHISFSMFGITNKYIYCILLVYLRLVSERNNSTCNLYGDQLLTFSNAFNINYAKMHLKLYLTPFLQIQIQLLVFGNDASPNSGTNVDLAI